MAIHDTPVREHAGAAALRRELLAGLPVRERRIDLAGISTPVLEGGGGRPVVLLHGPGEHAPKWLRVLPGLVATHRVVAPDLPGHGASVAGAGALDAARVLAWLDELVTRTCAEPPVLVGQIVGGAIAARYAAAHGERLHHLVLVDALGLAPFAPAPEFGAALAAFAAAPGPETHDALWRRCAFDLDRLQEALGGRWPALRAYDVACARDGRVQAAQGALMAAFGLGPLPEEELARITTPTTLVWGRHDLATPLAVAQAASDRWGWPLHVVDGAADDPPIEQPEAFLAALRAAVGEEVAA